MVFLNSAASEEWCRFVCNLSRAASVNSAMAQWWHRVLWGEAKLSRPSVSVTFILLHCPHLWLELTQPSHTTLHSCHTRHPLHHSSRLLGSSVTPATARTTADHPQLRDPLIHPPFPRSGSFYAKTVKLSCWNYASKPFTEEFPLTPLIQALLL